MKLNRTARSILSITALAWAIPLAQAGDRGSLNTESLRDRAYAARLASDSAITAKVKTVLLREPQLNSLDVSVETYRGEVLLSGLVKEESQRAHAVKAASTIAGVAGVKDGLVLRN